MFGSNRLGAALNVASITDYLDTYSEGLGGKALFPSAIIPEAFKKTEVVNFYMTSPYDPRIGYQEYGYTVACRSRLEHTSRLIAKAVKDEINEKQIESGTFYVSGILQTVPPLDETDIYNTPVTVILKSRT